MKKEKLKVSTYIYSFLFKILIDGDIEEEDYSMKQISGYKEQILGLERELEVLTNERDSLKVENQHLQIVVNGVKQEYKSFKYQNEPGHIIKSKELENNELKKEVEVMKSIMKRLEKDLWKYQENDNEPISSRREGVPIGNRVGFGRRSKK